MKKTFFLALFALASTAFFAQNAGDATIVTAKKLRVVFHLTTSDTLAQKALAKQCVNFLAAAPKSKIEVVCHNNGISFLQKSKTLQAPKIAELAARGVDFVACENTMRERKITRDELVGECRTVPSGVVEVVLKQDAGWSYIKSGL